MELIFREIVNIAMKNAEVQIKCNEIKLVLDVKSFTILNVIFINRPTRLGNQWTTF